MMNSNRVDTYRIKHFSAFSFPFVTRLSTPWVPCHWSGLRPAGLLLAFTCLGAQCSRQVVVRGWAGSHPAGAVALLRALRSLWTLHSP